MILATYSEFFLRHLLIPKNIGKGQSLIVLYGVLKLKSFDKLVFPEGHSMPRSQIVGVALCLWAPTRDLPSTRWFPQMCLPRLRRDKRALTFYLNSIFRAKNGYFSWKKKKKTQQNNNNPICGFSCFKDIINFYNRLLKNANFQSKQPMTK